MEIKQFGAADPDLAAGAFEVLRAAHAADTPEAPAPHEGVFHKSLEHPLPDANQHYYAAVIDGRVVGAFQTFFPFPDNLHFSDATLTVHPQWRRRGIGSALVEKYIEVARADGRRDLSLTTRMDSGDGPGFLERRGFALALTTVIRRGAVDAMDPADEQALLDRARSASEDYEVVCWVGRTPSELVEPVARLDSMILTEVPLGDLDLEPEVVDKARKEAKADRNEAVGIVPVQTVARHRASGEIVANTAIGVYDDPEYTDSFQWITIVDPAHRGHRLGTLVKILNLRLLRERYPKVEYVWTENADVNAHMIDINQKMGFETIGSTGEFQRKFES